MATATPGGTVPAGREARLLLLMASAWLLPWAMLSAAAQMSGGHPRASLTDLDPAAVCSGRRASGAGLVALRQCCMDAHRHERRTGNVEPLLENGAAAIEGQPPPGEPRPER